MKGTTVLVACLSLALCLASALSGHTAEKGSFATIEPKDVVKFPLVVNFQKPEQLQRSNFPSITFSHVQHQQTPCASCHHTWDGSSEIQGCATEGCHDNYSSKSGSDSYFVAFHKRDAEYSCYGCHLRMNKSLASQGQKALKLSPCQNNICHKK